MDLSKCTILKVGVNSILDALVKMQSLEDIKLCGIMFSNSSANVLCNVIANNTEIAHIEIPFKIKAFKSS